MFTVLLGYHFKKCSFTIFLIEIFKPFTFNEIISLLSLCLPFCYLFLLSHFFFVLFFFFVAFFVLNKYFLLYHLSSLFCFFFYTIFLNFFLMVTGVRNYILIYYSLLWINSNFLLAKHRNLPPIWLQFFISSLCFYCYICYIFVICLT